MPDLVLLHNDSVRVCCTRPCTGMASPASLRKRFALQRFEMNYVFATMHLDVDAE